MYSPARLTSALLASAHNNKPAREIAKAGAISIMSSPLTFLVSMLDETTYLERNRPESNGSSMTNYEHTLSYLNSACNGKREHRRLYQLVLDEI